MFLFQIFSDCNSESILKIGQYLAKLWTRVWCFVFFFDSQCGNFIIVVVCCRVVVQGETQRILLSV